MITSIPKLIETHGTLADTCRETGLNEMTLSKYRHDTKCEQHVIYNNRLMTHTKTSPVIYTKRGVSRNDRMKLEGDDRLSDYHGYRVYNFAPCRCYIPDVDSVSLAVC